MIDMASSCVVVVVCSVLLLLAGSGMLSSIAFSSATIFLGLSRGFGSPAGGFRFFMVVATVSTGH